MTIKQLRAVLIAEDQALIAPVGFGDAYAYLNEGDDGSEIAFASASNVTVAAMVASLDSAIGKKLYRKTGGESTAAESSAVYIGEDGNDAEPLGLLTTRIMLKIGRL